MINTVIASCNSSTLDPYVPGSDNPWNKAKVKHCYRRLGYGTDYSTITTGVNISPGALIDQIVDNAATAPLCEDPVWGYYRLVDFNDYSTENPEFINDFRIETGNLMVSDGLKGRMTFPGQHSIDVRQSAGIRLSYGQYIYRISFAGQQYSKSIMVR